MARRRDGGFDIIAKMPWPAGIVAGILGYVAIRYGIGWYFASSGSPIMQGFGRQASGGIYVLLAWVVLIACWAAAGVSFFRRRKNQQRLEVPAGLDSAGQMTPSISDAQTSSTVESATAPSCPGCGAAMFKRFNRQTNQMFWGCTHYPRCKGTRPT